MPTVICATPPARAAAHRPVVTFRARPVTESSSPGYTAAKAA
ncbi:hypothetical protein [Streptomyces sp. NBC_01233]|nr:hypothetical protein OG332_45215 [Streptomyces sp. NBC_01233]